MKFIHNNQTYMVGVSAKCGFLCISTLFFSVLISCEEFLDVGAPKSRIVKATIFSDDRTATASITGIYHEMIWSGFASGRPQSITALLGISADELDSYYSGMPMYEEFYQNSVTASNANNLLMWSSAYRTIYMANSIIENLSASSGVTEATKTSLEGEAKFVRAFAYFYLVNLFGDIPLVLTTDYRKNAIARRSPVKDVYQQIILDLQEAETLLSEDYPSQERVRPNKYAAKALLARTYLFTEDWANAEREASEVISNTDLYDLIGDLHGVFLKNSREAIWQLMPVQPGYNSYEASYFILTSVPTQFSLSDHLVNAFELSDKRRTTWIATFQNGATVFHYPFKYKAIQNSPLTEYSMVLRLAEQYLIRAEARARQNKLTGSDGAEADINAIRNRAGLDNTMSSTQEDLLYAVMQERRVELFTEWGHRWFDLKRMGLAPETLGMIKSHWDDTDILYPVPQNEILSNPNLNQNDGY